MTDPLAVPRDPGADAEDRFVLDAVRSLATGDTRDLSAAPGGDGWIERARLHGVLAVVGGALAGADRPLPAAIEQKRRSVVLRSLRTKADLLAIDRVLREAEVEWVVLKGVLLSDVVHRQKGTRESTDVDILVSPGHLPRAVGALETMGARRLGVDWSQRTWRLGSEVPMVLPSGTVLDLHWHLVNRSAMRRAHRLDTSALLQRRVLRQAGGTAVWSLDDTDLVLHVLLHSCLDGVGRLRAMLDVQQSVEWLDRRGVTPQQLATRAAETRVTSAAWLALSLTGDGLHVDLGRWTAALRPTAWARGVHGLSSRRSPIDDGLVRRLVRYTAPTSARSVAGVLSYGVDRLRRLVSPDDTLVSGVASGPDPDFEGYLRDLGTGGRRPARG